MVIDELVAYRVWKCKICGETRRDSDSMACHLRTHDLHSLEFRSTAAYNRKEVVEGKRLIIGRQ